jgi:hypothetical protein
MTGTGRCSPVWDGHVPGQHTMARPVRQGASKQPLRRGAQGLPVDIDGYRILTQDMPHQNFHMQFSKTYLAIQYAATKVVPRFSIQIRIILKSNKACIIKVHNP